MKIFPPLPGANKCQNDEQYIILKINQGGYINLMTIFINTFLSNTLVGTQGKVRSYGTHSERVYTVSTTHPEGNASYREDMVR
jgi:hypothetical protein